MLAANCLKQKAENLYSKEMLRMEREFEGMAEKERELARS